MLTTLVFLQIDFFHKRKDFKRWLLSDSLISNLSCLLVRLNNCASLFAKKFKCFISVLVQLLVAYFCVVTYGVMIYSLFHTLF